MSWLNPVLPGTYSRITVGLFLRHGQDKITVGQGPEVPRSHVSRRRPSPRLPRPNPGPSRSTGPWTSSGRRTRPATKGPSRPRRSRWTFTPHRGRGPPRASRAKGSRRTRAASRSPTSPPPTPYLARGCQPMWPCSCARLALPTIFGISWRRRGSPQAREDPTVDKTRAGPVTKGPTSLVSRGPPFEVWPKRSPSRGSRTRPSDKGTRL